MKLTNADRQLVQGALDSLAEALVHYDHHWSDGERAIYEQACTILGHPPAKDVDSELET